VIGFLLQSANLPFSIALGLMMLIAVMEGLGMMFGASISSTVDGLMPDVDVDVDVDLDVDVDVDADLDIDGPEIDGPSLDGVGGLTAALDWLRIGRVPVLILLLIFLCAFGLSGLMIQSMVKGLTGWLLPGILAAAPAFAIALPAVHLGGRGFERLFPKEETYVVSEASFIGEVATITLGTAETGKPAQAKLTDRFDRTHYLQVEPDAPDATFETGTQVLLVRRSGVVFKVIAATGALVSEEW
jgi:hypothetical protein